jgi:hypothetical protein
VEREQEAEARILVRSKGWPDSWNVEDAEDWFEERIPVELARRWADAGWPADLVCDFFRNGRDEWVELQGRDAMLQRDLADVAVDREQDGCTDG